MEARVPGSLGKEGAGTQTPEPREEKVWARMTVSWKGWGPKPGIWSMEATGSWVQTSGFLSRWRWEVQIYSYQERRRCGQDSCFSEERGPGDLDSGGGGGRVANDMGLGAA